jgi:hypothetical protein
MPIYRIENNTINPLERTTFARQGLRERYDLQTLLKARIEVISPNTLILAEEFGDWEDSRRRIDLLGIDKAANLVVIELKRTEDGGHMELQAVRYAAMVSTLTFDKLVSYLTANNIERDASESLLEFLGHRGTLWSGLNAWMQRCIEQILAIEISLVARFLVLHWLEASGERLVPFPRERRDVAEDFREALFTDVAGKGHRVQAGSAHRGIREQRIDLVCVLCPALREPFVFHHRQH